jgi:signal transduction histidine kinase
MDEQKGNILVRTSCEADSVVLEVQDDGRGMSEKTLQQIFDPFFTTKRAQGGTGLGLAISYRIIAEHGGSVSVTSAPGRGSTFTIRFPVSGGRLALTGAGAMASGRRAAREDRPHSR